MPGRERATTLGALAMLWMHAAGAVDLTLEEEGRKVVSLRYVTCSDQIARMVPSYFGMAQATAQVGGDCLTSTTVEPAESSTSENGPFDSPGTGTRSDSSTEPRSPSLFHKRSGSTRRLWLRRHGLLSKSRPSVSQCR